MSAARRQSNNLEISYRVIFVVMALWGVLMSVMVPPWQIPDEYAHVNMIGESMGNPFLGEVLLEDMSLEMGRIFNNEQERLDREQWVQALTKKPGYDYARPPLSCFRLTFLRHLPAGLGLLIGLCLHLPTFWAMTLGELLALAFYLAVCARALRIMPFKKEILLMFMVFPMSMQQAASLSYDAVMLPLSYLLIAYVFRISYQKEEVRWKQILCFLLLLAWITYIKIPYVFFGLLLFFVPREKIHLRIGTREINGRFLEKYRWHLAAAALTAGGIAIYCFRKNYWINLLLGMLCEWHYSAYLLFNTALLFGKFVLISSVGNFAWLNAPLPLWFVLGSYVLVLALALRNLHAEEYVGIGKRRAAVVWVSFCILVLFIVLSMVNHTIMTCLYGSETSGGTYDIRKAIYMISYVGGLQGRYFLPFLPLPFLVMGNRPASVGREENRTVSGVYLVILIYMALAIVMSAVVLYQRFWQLP